MCTDLIFCSQSQLPGFYDPCVGEEKNLLVQYLFHSHVHEVTIEDSESLRIPKQCEYYFHTGISHINIVLFCS